MDVRLVDASKRRYLAIMIQKSVYDAKSDVADFFKVLYDSINKSTTILQGVNFDLKSVHENCIR